MKKKKRKGSKSKRRRSNSRKRTKVSQDVDKLSFINRSSLGHKSSFSPGKDLNSTDKKVKASFCGTNHSQSTIKIKGSHKKGKPKGLKLNKKKSQQRLKIKTDRQQARLKKPKKSPSNTILKKGALEGKNLVSIDQIFVRNSIGKESNTSQLDKSELKKSKKLVQMTKATDFLSFVEEKERMVIESKEKRMNSIGAESTNAGVTNLGNTMSKNTTEIGNERPLSGGPPKGENVRGKKLIKKKGNFSRPKTAKHPMYLLEKSHEHKLSTLNPSSNSGDKDMNADSKHLQEIIESQNKNSSADFEYSSEDSDDLIGSSRYFTKQDKSKSTLGKTLKQKSNLESKGESGGNLRSTKFENLKQITALDNKELHSRNKDHPNSISDINPLKSLRRNPSEFGNDHQSHHFKESLISNSKKEFESELNTQLNMGSPVQLTRRKIPKKCAKIKRPSSANIPQFKPDSEPLKLDSLISIVGVKRNKCKMNLNPLLNSREVQSNYIKFVKTKKYLSRDSSAIRTSEIQKPIVIVQKNLRMYAVRTQIERQRELGSILDKRSLTDEEFSEQRGEGLKMSDLSYTTNPDGLESFGRNNFNTQMISEMIFPIPDSKIRKSNTNIILLNNRDGSLKRNRNLESENLLDFENTDRQGLFSDERDLNKNKIAMRLQESPLEKAINPEDEISIISSRIDINRKGLNNSTFEKIGSNKKNNLERSRIIESTCKKNKITNYKKLHENMSSSKEIIEECDVENDPRVTDSHVFKRNFRRKESVQDRNDSLKLLKKSLTERTFKNLGKHKDSMDALFKTHAYNSKKNSLLSKIKSIKKRPGSAGVNPSHPLDIQKMKSSLVLLKRSIQKSQRSSSNKDYSQEFDHTTKNLDTVHASLCVIKEKEDPPSSNFPVEKFKRSGKAKKKSIPKSDDKRNGSRSLTSVSNRKRKKDLKSGSPNGKILRHLFESDKLSKKAAPRVYNSSYISSLRTVKSSKVEDYVGNSEQDESMFENSTFGLAFQIPEYNQFLKYQIKEFKTMKKNIEEESKEKANELRSRLKEKMISDRSYSKEIKLIEIKEKSKKRQIKNNKKNFVRMLGKLHKD